MHYKVNPNDLDDETWAMYFKEYIALRKIEYENLGMVIKQSIAEVWNEINKK